MDTSPRRRRRIRPTYANVMSTIAVVLALGGSAWAATTVTGANVKNGTLTGADVKDGSLTGADIHAHSVPASKLSLADHVPHLVKVLTFGTLSHDATAGTTTIPSHGSFVQPAGTTLWMYATAQLTMACPSGSFGSLSFSDGANASAFVDVSTKSGPTTTAPTVLSPPSHSVTHTLTGSSTACATFGLNPTYTAWTMSHVVIQVFAV
jgi:hypothetical protein